MSSRKQHYSQTLAPQPSESSSRNRNRNNKDNKDDNKDKLSSSSSIKKPESKAPTSAPYATGLVRDEVAASSSSRIQDGTRLHRDDVPGSSADWRTMKTQYKTDHDKKMASRQVHIERLPAKEQEEQKQWAIEKLSKSAACPAGFNWMQVDNGYRCYDGGAHFITHELLAEGRSDAYYAMWMPGAGAMIHPEQGNPLRFGRNAKINMISAHGYWWMGPVQAIRRIWGSQSNANREKKKNETLGAIRNIPPSAGPGALEPNPRDLCRFGAKTKQFSSFEEAGVRFPKGKVCKPGKGYDASQSLFGGFGGFGGF